MIELLFWVFLVAGSVGLVWSLLQPDPFSNQVDEILEKLEKEARHG